MCTINECDAESQRSLATPRVGPVSNCKILHSDSAYRLRHQRRSSGFSKLTPLGFYMYIPQGDICWKKHTINQIKHRLAATKYSYIISMNKHDNKQIKDKLTDRIPSSHWSLSHTYSAQPHTPTTWVTISYKGLI